MCQISLAVKKFFRHGETYFLTNFFIPANAQGFPV